MSQENPLDMLSELIGTSKTDTEIQLACETIIKTGLKPYVETEEIPDKETLESLILLKQLGT